MIKNYDLKDSVVIGLGYWGSNIARELEKKGRLYGIIEPNKKIIKKFNVKILNFDDLNNSKIKNCFISSPSYLHYNHVNKVLKFKKNIFVEKPLAFNLKEINNLKKKILNKNINFMVGYLLLFHPALIKLKKLIKSEKNKLLLIKSSRKGNGKIRQKDNVLWNLAIHDLAYIFDILKFDIKDFKKLNFKFLNNKIDESKILIKFKNKITYSGEFSWLHHEKIQSMIFQTKNSLYIFDDLAENKLVKFKIKITKDLQKNSKIKFLKKEIINFENISPLENEINTFLSFSDSRKKYNNFKFTENLSKILLKLVN